MEWGLGGDSSLWSAQIFAAIYMFWLASSILTNEIIHKALHFEWFPFLHCVFWHM